MSGSNFLQLGLSIAIDLPYHLPSALPRFFSMVEQAHKLKCTLGLVGCCSGECEWHERSIPVPFYLFYWIIRSSLRKCWISMLELKKS